jgi:type III pantothenate kinase
VLLTVDIGNTNVVVGLFEGQQLKAHWRLQTVRQKLADEWGLQLLTIMRHSGYPPARVTGAIIASVVPSLTSVFTEMFEVYFSVEALRVEPGLKTGINLRYEDPRQLGADRLVNVVATWQLYGGPAIIVDCGTATKFEALASTGEYLGGAIAPGLRIGAEALFQSASRLFGVELVPPQQAIGRNIPHSLQAGIMLGYTGLVQGMLRRFRAEMKESGPVKVVATGGLASLIAQDAAGLFDVLDPELTLRGLQLLYAMNRP